MAGYSGSKDDYLKRLRRVEGQIRGISRMVEEDTYCVTYQQMIAWLELQDPEVLAAWRDQARSATGTDAEALGW